MSNQDRNYLFLEPPEARPGGGVIPACRISAPNLIAAVKALAIAVAGSEEETAVTNARSQLAGWVAYIESPNAQSLTYMGRIEAGGVAWK